MRLAAQATAPDIGVAPDEAVADVAAIAQRARQIVREYGAFIWRTLRYKGVADRDLEDVSQEVFIIVFRKLEQLEQPSSLRAWIYGICLRVAAGYRRRLRVRHEVLVHEVPEVSTEAGADEPERLHARRQLERLIARLDDDKREIFVLHEIEELPMDEIAEIVGCPVGTGYSRLAAAKKQILSMLSKLPKEKT